MTITDVKIEFQRELAILYGPKEIQSIFELIAEDLSFTPTSLIVDRDRVLSSEQIDYFASCLRRLVTAEPVQYVRGKSDFYGLQFAVNQSVLIPRPETEELVDVIIRENSGCSGKIIDLGTGSGCIAVSLAKNIKNAQIQAIDVSEKALSVATENARTNNVAVGFHLGDMQDKTFMSQFAGCSVVVSNPPYVCNAEKSEMRANVLDYEPHLALFVDDADPLRFYRAIAKFAAQNLVNGGKVYCEINESFGKETVLLFESLGLTHCEIVKDLFGKDRIIKALKE